MADKASWWSRFQNEHPNLQDCAAYARSPWLLPLYPVLVLFAASVGATLFSDTPERRNMNALLSDFGGRIESLITNPWFQALYLLAAFYAIFWAARDLGRKRREHLQNETITRQKALDELRREIARSMGVGVQLGEIIRLQVKINEASVMISKAQAELKEYGALVERMEEEKAPLSVRQNPSHRGRSAIGYANAAVKILNSGVAMPTISDEPKLAMQPLPDSGLASDAAFLISENPNWINWQKRCYETGHKAVQLAQQELRKQDSDMKHLIRVVARLPHDR